MVPMTARPIRRRTWLATLLLAFTPAFGQQAAAPEAAAEANPSAGGYIVEVIVFRGGSGGAGEDLGAADNVSAEGDSANGGSRTARLLQTLPGSRLKLGALANRLNATPGYKVIAHAAWAQTASSWGSRVGLPLEELGLNGQGLSGVIHLERGQYLHLGMNLTLAGSGGTWRMNEVRRVRLNDRQYFDHPAFGVIAVVSPPSP